jgi:hypothetical protein
MVEDRTGEASKLGGPGRNVIGVARTEFVGLGGVEITVR